MNKNETSSFYQIGGSLRSDSPSYVKRAADRQLEEALKQGQFCYVLNSRQMGKSSLRVRAMSKLQAEGTVCVFIDLNGIGTRLTAKQWYGSIMLEIVGTCDLDREWSEWIEKEGKRDLAPIQFLSRFIKDILLVKVKSEIIIFIDEIDRVLSQKFSLDDFFAFIHSCHEKRHIEPNYRRLTFTLLGVAAPRDLIENKAQSPFNVGKLIDLQGFKLEEAKPLKLGLFNKVADPEKTLAEILAWTAGQPFLTQKICQIVRREADKKSELTIAEIVEEHLIKDWQVKDEPEHFRTIYDRLHYRNSEQTICLLGWYRDILQKKAVFVDDPVASIELRLSGLVVERHGNLEVNNPIYAKVFNLAWVDAQLAQLRPYATQLSQWIDKPDPVYLLKGEELQATLKWAEHKTLANTDYKFLNAGQELETQKIENRLAEVESANKLLNDVRKQARKKVNKRRLKKRLLVKIALAVVGFVLLTRSTGILQAWEWNLLDRFFGWRLSDALDPRIVVVTINEKDLQTVGHPVNDRVLATAIENLKKYRPSAIGLDLYRDNSVPPGDRDLKRTFNSTDNLYVLEKVIGEAVAPPSNVDRDRIGFSDVVVDSDDKVRRALLSLIKGENKKYSLGTKLALHYLKQQDIEPKPLSNHRYLLGKTMLRPLTSNSGGYVRADIGGYQILLNYWGRQANFKQYSLTDVLNDGIPIEDIRDRLVLIGTTAESVKDNFLTPYSSSGSSSEMRGVFIHANVASQLISAAVDSRPLLRTHKKFWEFLAIFWVGIIGVITSWRLRSPIAIAFNICASGIILIVTCYLAFLSGWWLPLVPALLTFAIAAVATVFIRNKQRDRLKFIYALKALSAEFETNSQVAIKALEALERSEDRTKSSRIKQVIKKLLASG